MSWGKREKMDYLDKYVGCLLGGALGDALGYPVEFMGKTKIMEEYGERGVRNLELAGKYKKALISDDTQMTLFTADGLIWSHLSYRERGKGSYEGSGIIQSYYRWYYTQTGLIHNDIWIKKQAHETKSPIVKYEKTIMEYKELFANRVPGNSCLSALAKGRMGTIEEPINNSKGCGAVMRVAPVGLFFHKDIREAMVHGMGIAALTHGHPTGYIASGALAVIIAELVNGKSIHVSLNSALELLKEFDTNYETTLALKKAIELGYSDINVSWAINQLGQGWVAEEALAIAVYCVLKEIDFKRALEMAVNHEGDSDSTGAICGNILGAYGGMNVIPNDWLAVLEIKEFIIEMGEKLFQINNHFKML